MNDIVIRAENISKEYRLGDIGHGSLYKDVQSWWAHLRGKEDPNSIIDTIGSGKKYLNESFWALRDISFDIHQGEVLGIIGRNGAGKSTLLKILSRVTAPTKGTIKIKGRFASLLEVGTGFHPELTGEENIYLNGAILGMKKREIDSKFDDIVRFADVEKFLNTPVKRYSSGMYVKLAFAVAAHLDPEILLVDEVLAVGDIAFQRKCLGKMGSVAKEGRTVLFVSHNMAAIEGLCKSAFLLENGRLVMEGEAREVVNSYILSLRNSVNQPLNQRTDRQGDGKLRFSDIIFNAMNGLSTEIISSGQDIEFSIGYIGNRESLENVSISIGIFTLNGQCMIMFDNTMAEKPFYSIPPAGHFSCLIKRFPLAPGQYYINLYCEVNGIIADWIQQAIYLTVEAGDFFGTGRLPPSTHGGLLVPQEWNVKGLEKEA